MKIIHLVPGSGGTFYCENCMRDGALVKTLRAMGHDVVMAPLYLPLFVDDPEVTGQTPVFFGAVGMYLGHKIPLLRRLPRFVRKWLDSPAALRMAARREGSTKARGLESLTISMLKGETGGQAEELDRLVDWLARDGPRPDIVHLSNALLLGLARKIRQQLGTRIVCTLQDENTWLDAMSPDGASEAWRIVAERAAEADGLIAVSRYYSEIMSSRLGIPANRIHVVHIGVPTAGYKPSPLPFNPPVLGFLSKLTPGLGLGMLVEAFIRLRKQFPGSRLKATGGMTGGDSSYVAGLRRHLDSLGMLDSVEFLEHFDRSSREAFLEQLTVMSVPSQSPEAFGSHMIEAMATGVPVVQPRSGAFVEIVEQTGGGVLYEPNTVEALTDALASLLGDPSRTAALGKAGRASVLNNFSIEKMAKDTLKVYESVLNGRG